MFSSKSIRLALMTGREYGKRCISKTSSSPNIERFKHDLTWTCWGKLSELKSNRALSTLYAKTNNQIGPNVLANDVLREFTEVFPDVVRLLTVRNRFIYFPEVSEWFAKVLQYNVPNGKLFRGLTVVSTYKHLEDPVNLSEENVRLANILGWCVEMLNSFLLVTDDIIDRSETRRGVQCWYRTPGVGLNAFNDALLLQNGVYYILKHYFAEHPCYLPVLELFHAVTLNTVLGESLDILTHVDGKPNLDAFTMDRFSAIAKYKTGYYSGPLPVQVAMFFAGIFDTELHEKATTILLEIGHFVQVQNDFWDCYANSELTGKVGNDIKEGKCSWLVVVALQRGTQAQKQILYDNYGKPEPECEQAVKNLYEELNLPTAYSIYEEECLNLIRTHVQQISKELPPNVFFNLTEKIFKGKSEFCK